ncbi:phenylalanine--tRNA ligase subunit beta [Candidatus Micrarchaeota archaeon]|nr:phenylalanine--tRNA ligase subunit beta [Candidatus Micrarchaeota archaeon]
MVVVEFCYKEMKELVNIPREKMVESLSDLGAPSEYEPETDKILVELTPNRPDWYSMEGLARALRAYIKSEHCVYKTQKSKYKVLVDASVSEVRPYTVCAVVKGLVFNDQRIRDVVLLQEKLLATLGRKVRKFGLGLYPLSNITFPVKYTTMKPNEIEYVPLGHDKKMSAKEILELHKKGQQYGHLISGFEKYPVFVDHKGKIMALIPIVNSAETGKVDEETKEIFIEVTGTDLNVCSAALNILVCTFADMGGIVYEVEVKYKKGRYITPDLSEKKMKLNIEKINKLLGLELKEKEVKKLLERMGYGFHNGFVIIPPYRADIIDVVDIIEDIAIAYGYNNFKTTLPNFFTSGERIDMYDDVGVVLRGMGFLETTTFILTNKEKLERVGCSSEFVKIANPNSEEYTIVRPTLLADVLDVFATNKMKGLPQKFYEIGIVYERETKKKVVFSVMDKKVKFSDFKSYLQTLGVEIGIEFELRKKQVLIFEKEMSCEVYQKNKKIGMFGKVRKEVLDKFGVMFDVFVCELDLY